MYSYEIDSLLKQYNHTLPPLIYINICNSSPQLSCIKYNAWNDEFEMWDDASSYWKFKIAKNRDRQRK